MARRCSASSPDKIKLGSIRFSQLWGFRRYKVPKVQCKVKVRGGSTVMIQAR